MRGQIYLVDAYIMHGLFFAQSSSWPLLSTGLAIPFCAATEDLSANLLPLPPPPPVNPAIAMLFFAASRACQRLAESTEHAAAQLEHGPGLGAHAVCTRAHVGIAKLCLGSPSREVARGASDEGSGMRNV